MRWRQVADWIAARMCGLFGHSYAEADIGVPPLRQGARMKIRPVFAWYDFWVGVFVDRSKGRVYIFPVPMFGIVWIWRHA